MAKPLSAVLFDLFGTLLDVHSVSARADQLFPGHGEALSQLWRDKQLDYSRLRTLANRYVPLPRSWKMRCSTPAMRCTCRWTRRGGVC